MSFSSTPSRAVAVGCALVSHSMDKRSRRPGVDCRWAAAGFQDTLLRWNQKLEVVDGVVVPFVQIGAL